MTSPTDAQIDALAKLAGKHAEEQIRLAGEYRQKMAELTERQKAEANALDAAAAPIVLPAPSGKKRR
jgi:hypothetical protein